jgi:hypothetical protein
MTDATSNPAGSPTIKDTTPSRSSSATPDEPVPEEFTRFEGLARKLVNVPKPELDEKRRERP